MSKVNCRDSIFNRFINVNINISLQLEELINVIKDSDKSYNSILKELIVPVYGGIGFSISYYKECILSKCKNIRVNGGG